LPTQEAVLWRKVAFDVHKAQDPVRVLVSKEERSEPTHRVAHQMEFGDSEVRQDF
jgi:hypothetical protein